MDRHTKHQIVAATNNEHKLSEIRPLIEPDFRILSLAEIGCAEELPETHETLEENSLEKAAYIFNHYHVRCFADDTGLEVEALNGSPGVFSARYAGEQKNSEDNIALLLKNLSSASNRKARFRTVITLLGFDGIQRFEGIVTGTILHDKKGVAGFGYDPVFQPQGYSKTLAEMTMEEKNAISHRGEAIRKLVIYLQNFSRSGRGV